MASFQHLYNDCVTSHNISNVVITFNIIVITIIMINIFHIAQSIKNDIYNVCIIIFNIIANYYSKS